MSTAPVRLLIVDDDDELRGTLAARFERLGMAVPSGEGALAVAAKGRFDVALHDLQLPGNSGIELMGKLDELQPEAEALLLTAHGGVETAVQAMKQGAYDYVTKPSGGLVEVAEGGTLFIDEVAEMAPVLQAKLLRVLEDGHYRRVGSTTEQTADVRVSAFPTRHTFAVREAARTATPA